LSFLSPSDFCKVTSLPQVIYRWQICIPKIPI
jgi:hypothetical protein